MVSICVSTHIFLIFKKILFVFREGKGGRKGGKHQCVVASHVPPTGDLAHHPGMCPDWESNRLPFGLQAGTQPLSHTSHGYLNIYKPGKGTVKIWHK